MKTEFYLGLILVAVLLFLAFVAIPQILKLNRKLLDANLLAIDNEKLIDNMKIAGRKARDKNIKLLDEIKRKQRTLNHKDQELSNLKRDTLHKRQGENEANQLMVDAARTINNYQWAIISVFEQQGLEYVNKKNIKDFLESFLRNQWQSASIISNQQLDISIVHVERLLDWMHVDKYFNDIVDMILANVTHNITEFLEHGREGEIGYQGMFSNESHNESAAYFHNALLKDGFPKELISTDLLLFVNRILIHPIGISRGICLDSIAGNWIAKDKIIVIAYDNKVNPNSMFIYPHDYIKRKGAKALNDLYGSNGMVKPD